MLLVLCEPLLCQPNCSVESFRVHRRLRPDRTDEEVLRSRAPVERAPGTASRAWPELPDRGTPDGALVRKGQPASKYLQLRHDRSQGHFLGHWRGFRFLFCFGEHTDNCHWSPGCELRLLV